MAAIGFGTVQQGQHERIVHERNAAHGAKRQVDRGARRNPVDRLVDGVPDRQQAETIARPQHLDDSLNVALHVVELPRGAAAGVEEQRHVDRHRFDRDRFDLLLHAVVGQPEILRGQVRNDTVAAFHRCVDRDCERAGLEHRRLRLTLRR